MSAKEVMDFIVESYVHDVTNFYERERGRFVYKELAKKVFDPIQPEKVRIFSNLTVYRKQIFD